jgi:hypothetical protein
MTEANKNPTIQEVSSKDYYFDSYAHFGNLNAKPFLYQY